MSAGSGQAQRGFAIGPITIVLNVSIASLISISAGGTLAALILQFDWRGLFHRYMTLYQEFIYDPLIYPFMPAWMPSWVADVGVTVSLVGAIAGAAAGLITGGRAGLAGVVTSAYAGAAAAIDVLAQIRLGFVAFLLRILLLPVVFLALFALYWILELLINIYRLIAAPFLIVMGFDRNRHHSRFLAVSALIAALLSLVIWGLYLINEEVYADTQSSCITTDRAIQRPVRNLFTAWDRLDADLYAEQWANDGYQLDNGIRRISARALIERRRDEFAHRYRTSDVTVHTIETIDRSPYRARVGIEFSLATTSHDPSRNWSDDGARETFDLTCDAGNWRIAVNTERADW